MVSAMRRKLVAAIGALAVIVGLGWGLFVASREPEPPSWRQEAEGFLAVATPCCSDASLWSTLDAVNADGQRARPATAAETAGWINEWPYRNRQEDDDSDEVLLRVAAQSREVRCTGAPTGPDVRQEGDDKETLEAIRGRLECTYAKWKVWTGETAKERPNERHTVWVDEYGLFHGRVDFWR